MSTVQNTAFIMIFLKVPLTAVMQPPKRRMTEASVQNVRAIVLEANAAGGDAREKEKERGKEKYTSTQHVRRDRKPILPFSSMFIFTPTNPYVLAISPRAGARATYQTRSKHAQIRNRTYTHECVSEYVNLFLKYFWYTQGCFSL